MSLGWSTFPKPGEQWQFIQFWFRSFCSVFSFFHRRHEGQHFLLPCISMNSLKLWSRSASKGTLLSQRLPCQSYAFWLSCCSNSQHLVPQERRQSGKAAADLISPKVLHLWQWLRGAASFLDKLLPQEFTVIKPCLHLFLLCSMNTLLIIVHSRWMI